MSLFLHPYGILGKELGFNWSTTISSAPWHDDMVANSTTSSSHQQLSCYDVPTIDHRTATHAALPFELRLHLMCSAAPHQHTHAKGWLRLVPISIYPLAARDISLASISSEVSDDSLSRLVMRIGCRVSLSPHPLYRWPAS